MPIAKAVQMTGSFPVAFKSQTWKSDWGKYYIHYHSTRRELDLTGHNFTDGGLLSNFPIKYLDNENKLLIDYGIHYICASSKDKTAMLCITPILTTPFIFKTPIWCIFKRQ